MVRDAVDHINRLHPDAVFLTGDFVTRELLPKKSSMGAAWQCASILDKLECPHRYAVLGNHDVMVGAPEVTQALTDNHISVLRNASLPIERVQVAGSGLPGSTIRWWAIPIRTRQFPRRSEMSLVSPSSCCATLPTTPTSY